MKLTFDARLLTASGIGVYIQNVISRLADKEFDLHLLYREEDHQILSNLVPQYKAQIYNAPLYSIKELLYTPLKTRNTDIFWSPHFNIPLFNFASKLKIVTIHDVFHLAFYNTLTLKQKAYAKLFYQTAVTASDIIFTVSQFSKEGIVKHTKCNPDKIKVVYNGIDFYKFNNRYASEVTQTVLNNYKIHSPYILFVGNVNPHKNLRSALKGFREFVEASSHFSGIKFVIVGKREGFITGDLEINNILNQPFYTSRVQFTGWVRDEELPVLYQEAQAFVFPSVYEGFGFPPLEAMAAGCPVISSNFACMPEIYGSAAHYFNPLDPKDIGEKVYEILYNKKLRNELIEKGFAHAQNYTWEKTVSDNFTYVENYIHTTLMK